MAHPADKLIFDPCSNGPRWASCTSAHFTDDPLPLTLFCEDATKAGVVRGVPKYEIKEEEGLGDSVGEKGE